MTISEPIPSPLLTYTVLGSIVRDVSVPNTATSLDAQARAALEIEIEVIDEEHSSHLLDTPLIALFSGVVGLHKLELSDIYLHLCIANRIETRSRSSGAVRGPVSGCAA